MRRRRVLDELLPAAFHRTEVHANNSLQTDHGRLKARLRPMRGLYDEDDGRFEPGKERAGGRGDVLAEVAPAAVVAIVPAVALVVPARTSPWVGEIEARVGEIMTSKSAPNNAAASKNITKRIQELRDWRGGGS